MKRLIEELADLMVECVECGAEFRLYASLDSELEGSVVNGEPYCWPCLEKLVSEMSE